MRRRPQWRWQTGAPLRHRGELDHDAPFRKTAQAIDAARAKGILAVEMEAAALYTFARPAGVRVLCLAHVTNTMGQAGDDFEKGKADGKREALAALASIIAIVQDPP